MAIIDESASLMSVAKPLANRRTVTIDENSNRTHYTFASYIYDRSYSSETELQLPTFDTAAYVMF